MITVTEVRGINKFGQAEFPSKELSPKDALKQLVLNELGHGAIIVESTPTIILTSVQNPDETKDQVIFEGPEEEMKSLIFHSKLYRFSWQQNDQCFENLFSLWNQLEEKAQTEQVISVKNPEIQKNMPIFMGLYVPVLLGQNADNIHILFGQGKRVETEPRISDEAFEKTLKNAETNLATAMQTIILSIAPIADA